MSSSWLFRSSLDSDLKAPGTQRQAVRGLLATVLLLGGCMGCRKDATDPRFDDPALLRPNDSKKLSVVFVEGTPVPVESASKVRRRATSPPPSPAPVRLSVRWNVPNRWVTVPPSSHMRLAEYRVPGTHPEDEAADLGVFFLGPSTSAIEDTLQRWVSSFEDASPEDVTRSERRSGPYPTHLVEASGTYRVSAMMRTQGLDAGPPTRPGWALLGAIVETSVGPYYFKLLGPKRVVLGARAEFLEMIDSVGRTSSTRASASSGSVGSSVPVASSPPTPR